MLCVRGNMVMDTRDVAFTASYPSSCAKEEISREAMALVAKVSTAIILTMKHSLWLMQSQVNVLF